MEARYDYSKLASTSVRLINKFGKSILKRTITNVGDEWNRTQVNIDTAIDGVIVDYGSNEIDNTLILAKDKKLLTTSLVSIDNKIVDGSIAYSVISVSVVEPATTSLLYKIQLRT